MIDVNTLRELLDYDPETGVFRWRQNRTGTAWAGSVAGCQHRLGYVQIRLFRRNYLAHRLAWLYVYGVWPAGYLDHVDRDRANNRISNLRLASRSQNGANRKKSGGVGCALKGVTRRRNKYQAYLKVDRKQVSLGIFATEQEAHEAYCKAARQVFGAFFHAG